MVLPVAELFWFVLAPAAGPRPSVGPRPTGRAAHQPTAVPLATPGLAQDYQWDMTWVVIKQLEKWGLASNIKLPSEKQKERLRLPKRTWEGAAIKA